MIAGLLRTGRPKQWLKNILVFAAPGAAGVLDDGSSLVRASLAFVSFCLAASGTYFWNDVLDVDVDRTHPTKRNRPIAAGTVSIPTARVVGVVLLAAALGVAALTDRWETIAIVGTYIALTLGYSVVLKQIAVVDLVAIASGFVLRAAAGAVAVNVPMSNWFVLCTTFGSLFIVAGKRYAELNELGDEAGSARSTLTEYSVGFLRIVLTVSLAATLVSYCQWAFETRELSSSDWPLYELSIVPMLTALLRYGLVLDQGHGAAPEEVFANDRVLQVLGLAWLVVYGLAVYTR
jgi:decaprenyl-phosphate phosphoribosyltransferase